MRTLELAGRTLTDDDVFVVAEIGANHMGDPDICEQMIVEAAKCGADAVKLQKRNNREMFTKGALEKPYQNELSYGATYGEHREYLDWFGDMEYRHFKNVADKHGVLLFATPFEQDSALFLDKIGIGLFKIASCDVKNVPFVRFVASFCKPMLISTGGASVDDIERLYNAIYPVNPNFAFLHCVSLYPNTDDCLNLNVLRWFLDEYPEHLAGFSSHHAGILPLMVARTLGASIFEVHFTLNRGWRGTDHGFSVEPRGLETLCTDLKRVSVMMGNGYKFVHPDETTGFVSKMGKGIYLNKPLPAGHIIREIDICIKSPSGDGFQPYEVGEVVGGTLVADCATGINLGREWLK